MKLLVLSDTHGSRAAAEALFRAEAPDAAVHLGDFVRDADGLAALAEAAGVPFWRVPGNCDGLLSAAAPEIVFSFGGVRFFALHGHTRAMRLRPDAGIAAARAAGADALLYGHTHVPLLDRRDGILVLNPGSARLAPGSDGIDYAVVFVRDGQIRAELRRFPRDQLLRFVR